MTGEGSLGASFIPVFVGYLRNGPSREAWAFAQKAFWDMALLLGMFFGLEAVNIGAIRPRCIGSLADRNCCSSFRDGPKDQTSDVQLHIGESRDSGFDAEPVIGPRFARTRWHRPGMTGVQAAPLI